MSELTYEIKDGIGYITFNRPQARNALTFEMYDGAAKICREAQDNSDLKVIIISGAGGKSFGAGTDISLFKDFTDPEHALGYESKMDSVLTDIETCAVPTIAAITGACTGGGAAIAAACDIRIADANLAFGFPMAKTLGNCLSINNLKRLSNLLGASRIKELMFTARLIRAEEAKAIGLVSEVLDQAEDVLPHATELAQTLMSHAPLTLKATKEGLNRIQREGNSAQDDDLIVQCYMSNDFKEGMDAFLNKRKPVWKGQ